MLRLTRRPVAACVSLAEWRRTGRDRTGCLVRTGGRGGRSRRMLWRTVEQGSVFSISTAGQTRRAVVHGGRCEPYRPVRLQAGTHQTPWRAVRFWRACGERSRTDWGLGRSRSGNSLPMANVARCSAKSWPTWARASMTSPSSTTWSARPVCTARPHCCRPRASTCPVFPGWAAGSVTAWGV